jgi:hypothetical protein
MTNREKAQKLLNPNWNGTLAEAEALIAEGQINIRETLARLRGMTGDIERARAQLSQPELVSLNGDVYACFKPAALAELDRVHRLIHHVLQQMIRALADPN